MNSIQDIERQYNNLRSKKETLAVRLSNLNERIEKLKERARVTTAKQKEVNIRCDKLERFLYPDRKLNQTKSERFRSLAKRVLPPKLYSDLWTEAMKNSYVGD